MKRILRCHWNIVPHALHPGRFAAIVLPLVLCSSGCGKPSTGGPGPETVSSTGRLVVDGERFDIHDLGSTSVPVAFAESSSAKPSSKTADAPDPADVRDPAAAAEPAVAPDLAAAPEKRAGDPAPLNPQKTVLLDAARKRLLLKSQVVLREGVLEMFACLAGTKEHESVVAVDTEAYVIHAGLLAVGAEPGKPVQFEPEYRPPQGQRIDIFVNWTDENGRPHRRPAQHWVRHVTRRYYLEPLDALPEGLTLPEDSELRYDQKRKELIWFGPMSEASCRPGSTH